MLLAISPDGAPPEDQFNTARRLLQVSVRAAVMREEGWSMLIQ